MPIATAPSINRGPDVLEKQIVLSASIFDIIFFFLKLDTIFAPIGYPDTRLMERGKAEAPGVLNKGFIKGSKNLPTKSTNPMAVNTSVTMKKGSKEGMIMLNHINKPS
ncbi:hypothetical protein CULT_1440008 [[Clostridium] ultunense Esp]|nr:hypothetical protein CULT_1440008 [[Clostridium] ultunense Esp]